MDFNKIHEIHWISIGFIGIQRNLIEIGGIVLDLNKSQPLFYSFIQCSDSNGWAHFMTHNVSSLDISISSWWWWSAWPQFIMLTSMVIIIEWLGGGILMVGLEAALQPLQLS